MSANTWPTYAIRKSDSARVTPQIGAQNRTDVFHIGNAEVIPVCGSINTPHWRGINGGDYSRPVGMQAREMSPWHRAMIDTAIQRGLIDEYRVPNSSPLMIADAFDESTNTIYEYVWSHDDPAKVDAYFELGYNQVWIFASEKDKWSYRISAINSSSPHNLIDKRVFTKEEIQELNIILPKIEARYD